MIYYYFFRELKTTHNYTDYSYYLGDSNNNQTHFYILQVCEQEY
jgi:hypothetical protein